MPREAPEPGHANTSEERTTYFGARNRGRGSKRRTRAFAHQYGTELCLSSPCAGLAPHGERDWLRRGRSNRASRPRRRQPVVTPTRPGASLVNLRVTLWMRYLRLPNWRSPKSLKAMIRGNPIVSRPFTECWDMRAHTGTSLALSSQAAGRASCRPQGRRRLLGKVPGDHSRAIKRLAGQTSA